MRLRTFVHSMAATLMLSSGSSQARRGSQASSSSSGATAPWRRGDVLLVFFSRAGENYFNGGRKDLAVGNTEVVAGMIRDALHCDVFQIEAVDP